MRKAIVSLPLLLFLFWCGLVSPDEYFGEDPPGHPVGQHPDWPEGLGELLTRGGRVYSSSFGWLGGDEDSFYFSGDTDDFNWFIEQYAKLKGVSRALGLHPGRGEARGIIDKRVVGPFDWKVRATSHWAPSGRNLQISLDLWVGGQVALEKLRVPPNIQVAAGETETKPSAREGGRAAETSEAVRHKSKRLLYGKLALTEDNAKILSVVLDESAGTRTGYDLLYADVNLNGEFEETEKRTAKTANRHGTWLASSSFPPFTLDMPHNEKAQGIPNPCELTLGYRQYPRPGVAEDISVTAKVKLRQSSTLWEYSFSGSAIPSKTREGARVWSISEKPKLELTTRPDGYRKGNLGIGLTLSAGENGLQCRKAGEIVKAHVEIKKPDGTVAHRGDATLDKFTFG